MNIKCFNVIPNHRQFVYLRRFTYSDENNKCINNGNFGHDAMIKIEDRDIVYTKKGYIDSINYKEFGRLNEYPKLCNCGYEFKENDIWQIHTQQQYIREDKLNDEIYSIRNLPIGAIYEAYWLNNVIGYFGLDGKSLHVITAGGEWNIDSQASNCTKPNDNIHKCWCRHGISPNLTVNKIGNTCNAGGGSIIIGNYHGFLINGELTNC